MVTTPSGVTMIKSMIKTAWKKIQSRATKLVKGFNKLMYEDRLKKLGINNNNNNNLTCKAPVCAKKTSVALAKDFSGAGNLLMES